MPSIAGGYFRYQQLSDGYVDMYMFPMQKKNSRFKTVFLTSLQISITNTKIHFVYSKTYCLTTVNGHDRANGVVLC